MMIKGGCSCGAVRYEIDERLKNLCYCHCESCRRATGAPYVAWGTVGLEHCHLTGDIDYFSSSEKVSRGFCKACGTSLTYQHQARPRELDITLASLDKPEQAIPVCHIWVADKLQSIVIGDDLPQYSGWKSDG